MKIEQFFKESFNELYYDMQTFFEMTKIYCFQTKWCLKQKFLRDETRERNNNKSKSNKEGFKAAKKCWGEFQGQLATFMVCASRDIKLGLIYLDDTPKSSNDDRDYETHRLLNIF